MSSHGRGNDHPDMGSKDDSLAGYRSRRNFRRTPEPSVTRRRRGKEPRFVVQQHDATSMHFDFRLEVDGVLKSWAVPKGPSLDPRDKRLAMPTEDHPLSYGDFEGVIPEGEYGAGPVIVWDAGTYRNLTANGRVMPMGEALERGHAKFWLEGHKLAGGFALTRTSARRQRAKWLLVKLRDEAADARRKPLSTQPESVISGLTIDEMRRRRSA
jgi:DNA ligase D-like protein (predicted 3'-phosphoesterase)